MTTFSLLDWLALAFFGLGWAGYQLAAERTTGRRQSLNVLMNNQRHRWIVQMVRRENRILDVNINASLQNGTAFFASASLIALGAALTLLRSTDDALHLLSEMNDAPSPCSPSLAYRNLSKSCVRSGRHFDSWRTSLAPEFGE